MYCLNRYPAGIGKGGVLVLCRSAVLEKIQYSHIFLIQNRGVCLLEQNTSTLLQKKKAATPIINVQYRSAEDLRCRLSLAIRVAHFLPGFGAEGAQGYHQVWLENAPDAVNMAMHAKLM
jgi:hypothetical protein